jgi:hypothetical protein
MSGRRGGRIGVDRYPRLSVAQGVWRLNEAHFESRFNSWPVVFYPGFVTPTPQFQLRISAGSLSDFFTKPGAEFTFKGLPVFSQTNDFFDLLARSGLEFTSNSPTVFLQANAFVDVTEKPGKIFTFKDLPVFLTTDAFSNTLPAATILDNTGAVS